MAFKQKLIGFLVLNLIRILRATLKFEIVGQDPCDELTQAKQSYLLASWHQNLLCMVISQKSRFYAALTSPSKDGDIVSLVTQGFGFKPVRGSSSRGGARASLELVRLLKGDTSVAITVDGPRGPKGEVKPGIIWLSQKSYRPIVALTAIPTRYWELRKSWDHFRIPKPFSTVHLHYKKLLLYEETPESALKILQEALNQSQTRV